VGGQRVDSDNDYFNILSTKQPGEGIVFELNRNGHTLPVQIIGFGKPGVSTTASVTPATVITQSTTNNVNAGRIPSVGLAFMQSADGNGLLVSKIVAGKPASQAGLHIGDRVTAVNNASLRTQMDYSQAIAGAAEGSTVSFRVLRDGRVFTVPVLITYQEGLARSTTLTGTTSDLTRTATSTNTGTQRVVGMAFVSEEEGGATNGLLIALVAKDLPARKAGIIKGDVVKSVNGRFTRTQDEYAAALSGHAPGTVVNFLIERDGEDMTFPITLGAHAAPMEELISNAPARPAGKPQVGILIAKTAEGVEADGIYVSKVKPDGPAALAGLRDGDMLKSIKNQRVRSQADYLTVIGTTRPGDVVAFDLVRHGLAMSIAVTVGSDGSSAGTTPSFAHQGSNVGTTAPAVGATGRQGSGLDGAPRRRHFQYGAKSQAQL